MNIHYLFMQFNFNYNNPDCLPKKFQCKVLQVTLARELHHRGEEVPENWSTKKRGYMGHYGNNLSDREISVKHLCTVTLFDLGDHCQELIELLEVKKSYEEDTQ